METMQIPADNRSECESDQPECDGHLCYGFVVQCRDRGRVRRRWASTDPNRKSRSRAASQRYAQVIDIRHTHLSAGRPHGSAFLLLRLEPLHRARLGHELNRLWLVALRGGLCFLAVEFVEAITIHLRIEHFECSAAGVDLIVMREIGKAFENAEQLLVPCPPPDLHIAGATLRAEWPEPRQLVAALGCSP
jgi:hypothetical protein